MNSLALGLDRGHTRPNKILMGTRGEIPKLATECLKVGIYSLSDWYKISGRPIPFRYGNRSIKGITDIIFGTPGLPPPPAPPA
jgi:hypothetical protein